MFRATTTLRTRIARRSIGPLAVIILALATLAGALSRPAEAAQIPTLSVGDLRVVEGDFGQRSVAVTLRLDRPAPSDKIVSVRIRTFDGTATAAACAGCPGDYAATNVLTSFPPGTTTRTVLVTVLGDFYREADETFRLIAVEIENASVLDPEGVITIANDDILRLP